MTVVQLDLFGEIEAAELAEAAARDSAAMQAAAFLVETPWPDLLAWWIHTDATESRLDHGECKASYRRSPDGSPGWAWAIWRDGLRFEAGDSWSAAGGWRHRPRCCIPWVELRAFRNAHPEVTARLQELAAGRGDPHARGWRWWIPPHGLRPDGMHESYVTSPAAEATGFFYAADAVCRASPALRMLRAACSSAGAVWPQRWQTNSA